MPIQPRPEIERISPVPHGGFTSAHAPENLLDFSANINTAGPSPRVWEAMRTVPLAQHPDPEATLLRQALATANSVNPAALLVGNGAADLIYQIAVAYLRPADRVLIVGPTFGEYAAAAALMGADIRTFDTQAANDFELDGEELLRYARNVQPRLLFLCNPNNPTGSYQDREMIACLLESCPDTLLILDEAFIRFVAFAWPAIDLLDRGNLLILRSMTKDYALTGLRLGYALAHPDIIAALAKVQPPWSVNALAQAAALAALADEEHLRMSLAALAHEKAVLVHDLTQISMWPLPSRVHFFLLPVPSAVAWTEQLREQNILVRDCSSFGLPTFIRIAPRQAAENTRLVAALAQIGGRLCGVRC